jgi:hypothetical protein
MSVFVQEVLGLLKRNFVKTTLNPTDDYFQFVRKGAFNRAKASAGGFAPQGQALSISAGNWLCSQTGPNGLGRFVSTVKFSGEEAGTLPMFWLRQGQCDWHSLKDSIIRQDTFGPIIYIGSTAKPAELIVYGKAYVTSLVDKNLVISGQDGVLKGTDRLTYGPQPGTAGIFLENKDFTIFGEQNTTINPPCFPPQTKVTMWSNLGLYGGVHFQGPNPTGSEGQIMVQRDCGRLQWEDQKGVPDLQFGELIIGYQNPQPAPGTIVPAVGSFSTGLGTGNNGEVLTSGGANGFPSWVPNPSMGGSGTPKRLSMFFASNILMNSLLVQDNDLPVVDPGFANQTITNDGKWINTGTMKLLDVPQDATQEKVLVLDTSTGQVKFRFANSIGVQGTGTLKRVPLWTPDGANIRDSLLVQSNDIQPADAGFSSQKLTNDGSLQQTKELYLDTVAQDDTLTQVLVRHPSAANEVKFRDAATIAPAVGFDTLPMSTTANWNQTFLNAYISLDDTTVQFTSIKGMTTLTDGQTGVVIAENVKQNTFLADDVLRFPSGWGTPGNLFDNKMSWTAGVDNGYPTSTLKYGESLKFKYHNYEIPGGGFTYKYVLYWEACCKLLSSNTCPTVEGQIYNMDEDSVGVNDTVTFVDDFFGGYTGVFTASALADPAAGTLTFNSVSGAWSFVPALNYYGSTTFTFTYNDGYCDSAPGTITLNVLPVAEPPSWTSQDPVDANTYPNLTGGDAWTYTWTTEDTDHPCNLLTYNITVNENNTGPVIIYTTAGGSVTPNPSWLTFTPDPNNNCTGTLSGTYPPGGGNFQVVMTVTDPDGNAHVQSFVIGGLLVTKDTYFCFYSDTSTSMDSTIITTAIMSSVPEVKCTLNQNATGIPGGNYTMVLARGNNTVPPFFGAGRVNAANGLTDQAHLCVVDGMEVSGPGVPAGTVVFNDGAPSGGLRGITVTPPSGTNISSQTGDIITFTLTQAQKTADYNNTTNFRNLLQDYYATGGTLANGNTNSATNGQDFYDSHLYWYHSGVERPLGYLGFRAQGGPLVASIGPTGYFPNAENIVVMAWADESGGNSLGGGENYDASPGETGSESWNNRNIANPTNPPADVNPYLVEDCANTRNFIGILEAQANNNTIYRGIAFRVKKVNADGSTPNNDLEQIMGPGGFAQTGGRTAFGFLYGPEATAYSLTPPTSLQAYSQSSPARINYVGNVTAGVSFGNPTQAQTYYYNLVKAELLTIGYSI